MHKIPAVFNWSGGKDSTLALHYVLQERIFDVRYLLTTVNGSFNRVAIHGVRKELLLKQSECLNLPLFQINLPETGDTTGSALGYLSNRKLGNSILCLVNFSLIAVSNSASKRFFASPDL